MTCFANGHYGLKDEIFISPFDLGFQRGLTVFEAFRTYQKTPLFLERRLKRLATSAKELRISLPENIPDILDTLIQNSPYAELLFKIYATRSGAFIILTEPFQPYPTSLYSRGAKGITLPSLRPLPHIKTTCYVASMVALEDSGADEALYINQDGVLLEGSRSNLFVVQNANIYTPPEDGILPGITRGTVMSLRDVQTRVIRLEQLPFWEEAFLTSSTRGVFPLTSINGHAIGGGVPGRVTKKVMHLFELTLQEALDKATLSFDRIERNPQF